MLKMLASDSRVMRPYEDVCVDSWSDLRTTAVQEINDLHGRAFERLVDLEKHTSAIRGNIYTASRAIKRLQRHTRIYRIASDEDQNHNLIVWGVDLIRADAAVCGKAPHWPGLTTALNKAIAWGNLIGLLKDYAPHAGVITEKDEDSCYRESVAEEALATARQIGITILTATRHLNAFGYKTPSPAAMAKVLRQSFPAHLALPEFTIRDLLTSRGADLVKDIIAKEPIRSTFNKIGGLDNFKRIIRSYENGL